MAEQDIVETSQGQDPLQREEGGIIFSTDGYR